MSYPSAASQPQPAKCPCRDCSLTAPIRGWFAMNPSVRGQVPAPASYSRQLENHRLPTHLQDYDVASPRINSVLSIEKGSIVEAIYLYTKFTAACIFHEWAACEEELVLLQQKSGVGVVGGQQHLELALMGRKNTDWAAVWQSIWMPKSIDGPGLSAEQAKALAYNTQLHASNAGVELMLRGFPRLDAFSPHRIQVLGHRTYSRQGYSLRIHHRRVPAAWRGLNPNATGPAMDSFYDTAEISPIPVQEGLIRLMLPIPEVHLWGDCGEIQFLGPIRLAHELILNEWASEARLLHMSRHEFPPKPGQEIRLSRPPLASMPVDGNSAAADAEQPLDVAVELRELARYFRVIRAIQEVLVLNELVMQCTKPAGSSAALVQRTRLQEQMDLRDLHIGRAVSLCRGEGLGPASRRSIHEQGEAREILAQKHLNDIATARKLSPYQPGGPRINYNLSSYKLNDPSLSVEPQWVASLALINPALRPASGGISKKPRTASPSELSFLTQTAEQRAHRVRTLHPQPSLAMNLEGDFQRMLPPPPRMPSGVGLTSVAAERLPRVPNAHHHEGTPVNHGSSYHWQPLLGAAAGQHTPRQLQYQPQMEQRRLPANPLQHQARPPFIPNSSFPPHQLPRSNQTQIPFSHILNLETPGSVRDQPIELDYIIVSPSQIPTGNTGMIRDSRNPIAAQIQSPPSVLLPPITAHTPTSTPTPVTTAITTTTTLPLPRLSELDNWTAHTLSRQAQAQMKRASVESMESVGSSSEGSGSSIEGSGKSSPEADSGA